MHAGRRFLASSGEQESRALWLESQQTAFSVSQHRAFFPMLPVAARSNAHVSTCQSVARLSPATNLSCPGVYLPSQVWQRRWKNPCATNARA